MISFLDCWKAVASTLFSQALAGEPELVESTAASFDAEVFGATVRVTGDLEGMFTVLLDTRLLDSTLLGEGVEQRSAWGELLRETAESAAGEMLIRSGKKCQIQEFTECNATDGTSRVFQLKSPAGTWILLVNDDVREAAVEPAGSHESNKSIESAANFAKSRETVRSGERVKSSTSPDAIRLDLLLDVELEAALRFGCREMPLGELLDLGPGDLIQLDRHVADPVDLIVGDKIVARGEVVLVDGEFGLRVTEVAAPQKRLESIRCLF